MNINVTVCNRVLDNTLKQILRDNNTRINLNALKAFIIGVESCSSSPAIAPGMNL